MNEPNDPIAAFEQECADAGVSPVAVLRAAGLHRATWFRWKGGSSSPTLRKLQDAQNKLREIVGAQPAGRAEQPRAA